MEGGLGTQHRSLFADCDFFKRDKGILIQVHTHEDIQVLLFKGASQTWDTQRANSLAGVRLGVGVGDNRERLLKGYKLSTVSEYGLSESEVMSYSL